jgi:hypothetical protein
LVFLWNSNVEELIKSGATYESDMKAQVDEIISIYLLACEEIVKRIQAGLY